MKAGCPLLMHTSRGTEAKKGSVCQGASTGLRQGQSRSSSRQPVALPRPMAIRRGVPTGAELQSGRL